MSEISWRTIIIRALLGITLYSVGIGAGQNVKLIANLGGTIESIAVYGKYVYVTDQNGISIFNQSNDTTFRFINKLNLYYTKQVKIQGNYMYVADGAAGLKIFNLINPQNPQIVGSFVTPGVVTGMDIRGNYVYLADWNYLRILNISNPASPIEVGNFSTSGLTENVTVSGDYAYVPDDIDGLMIINISDPTKPVQAGYSILSSFVNDVAIQGDYAYIANASYGLSILNIANKNNPIEVGYYNTSGYSEAIKLNGNYAYMADGDAGLVVIKHPHRIKWIVIIQLDILGIWL